MANSVWTAPARSDWGWGLLFSLFGPPRGQARKMTRSASVEAKSRMGSAPEAAPSYLSIRTKPLLLEPRFSASAPLRGLLHAACQYPVCVGVDCDNRRDQGKMAAFEGDPSEYLCQTCMYPRCTRCNRTKRPERSRCSVQRIPEWFCNKYAKCREAAQKKD